MKIRLVTQVEPATREAILKIANRETRTESAMANLLLLEALAARARKSPRQPMPSSD